MADTRTVITTVSLCLLLTACGGGGADGSSNAATTETGSTEGQNLAPGGSGLNDTRSPTGTTDTGATAGTTSDAGNTLGNGSSSFMYDTTARFNTPSDLVIDSAGNLFLMDLGNKAVRRIASGGQVTTLPSSYDRPLSSIAIDRSGNLYVIDGEDIYTIAPTGARSLLMTYPATPGSTQAVALAADGTGSIYVLARYRNEYWIHKIDPANPPQGVFYGNGSGPHQSVYSIDTYGEITGIASDANGNLAVFISGPEAGHAELRYVPVAAQPVVEPSSAVKVWSVTPGVSKMTFDAAGDLWLTDSVSSTADSMHHFQLLEIAPTDGTISTRLTTFPTGESARQSSSANGFGLALDSTGNIFVADPDVDAVFNIAVNGEIRIFAGKEGEAGNSD